MSKTGDKRSADETTETQFSDEQISALEANQKALERIELGLEREAAIKVGAFLTEKRRPVLKSIPSFWPTAFKNHPLLGAASHHPDDTKALSFLEDVIVTRDPKEHRAYTIEFHFGANPFFTDSVLRKEIKFVTPSDAAALKEDENGVSDAAFEFDFSRDTEPSTIKINWKDPATALTKISPRVYAEDDQNDVEDPGSFFNMFETKDISGDLENAIALDLYPDAVLYFLGRASDDDDSDIDSEQDDSGAEDIDLEKPMKKKAKA